MTQPDLFVPEENPNLSAEARQRLSNQLIRLGDMMGDGLHHEPDGRWIAREYRHTLKALYPDIYKNQRVAKNKKIDGEMTSFLAEKKCPCGGVLNQTRSGAKMCRCAECGKKYQVKTRRSKK